jgi:hypothetical protein
LCPFGHVGYTAFRPDASVTIVGATSGPDLPMRSPGASLTPRIYGGNLEFRMVDNVDFR